MKVFLSWSGEKSLAVAELLREWLPNVIQGLEPWISSNDIEKGARWSTDIAEQLHQARVGIICLTADNLEKPWLLFEAGALSKTLTSSFVCPYLVGIEKSEVQGPLSLFQLTLANEDDTKRLIHTLNRAQEDLALPESRVNSAFQKWWPDLSKHINDIVGNQIGPKNRRPESEILSEILDLVRSQGRILSSTTEGLALLSEGMGVHKQGSKNYERKLEAFKQEWLGKLRQYTSQGAEVKLILEELNRHNRTLLVMAFEDAEVRYQEGKLVFLFASEDVIAKKVRASSNIFHDIGMRLFNKPLDIEVIIVDDLTRPALQDDDTEIPF